MIVEECCFTVKESRKACWRLTTICNLDCKHCFANSNPFNTKNPISKEKLFKVIDELKLLNIKTVILSGGEPLLHPYLIDIIKKLKKNNFIPTLTTNAKIANSTITKNLFDAGLKKVTISLDGDNSETYSKVRGASKSSFYQVIKGIKNFIDIKIPVTINVVLHNENINRLLNIIKLAEKLKVDSITFSYPVCQNKDLETVYDLRRQIINLNILNKIEKYIETTNINIKFRDPNCYSSSCPAGEQIIGVTEYGNIIPCLGKSWIYNYNYEKLEIS